MKTLGWILVGALALFGCDDGASDTSAAADSAVGGGGGGGGGDAGVGGDGGGGGEAPVERSIDERCPDAQTGHFVLVLYPDRVDAYRQQEFDATYSCEFLALGDNGITHATGIARNSAGNFLVVQPDGEAGEVHEFSANGEYLRRVERNINLAAVDGIWPQAEEGFVTWNGFTGDLHGLTDEGLWRGRVYPPESPTSQARFMTDLVFLDTDAMVATFADRPAKLYKWPNSPSWDASVVGPGNAVVAAPTREDVKLLMTAQLGDDGYALILFDAPSGRTASEINQVLVPPGQFREGLDLLLLDDVKIMVLDGGTGGAPTIWSYNLEGELQAEIALEAHGEPVMMMREQIFPDL